MNERWLVIGTDERMKYLAKQLTNDSRTVYYKNRDAWDTELNKTALEFHPTHIVLPIQSLQLKVEQLAGISQAQIFAGRLTDEWHDILKNKELYYYLQDETFIWKNAALTAEGLLAYLYTKNISVQHKRILITGFGRVGKMLALFLNRLHAQVMIAVRSKTQQAEAIAYGYEGIELSEKMPKTDLMINTIPTKWLNDTYQPLLSCPIYDVASAPGCLDELKLSQYELLPALPGKFFPQAAASVMCETVLRLRKEHINA